jgi:molybdopterin-containing oxidoreductase family iron-sulfur binding subunit
VLSPGHTAEMSRLYVAESSPTNTGSKADHRVGLKAREIPALAQAVAAGLGVSGAAGQAPGESFPSRQPFHGNGPD